MVAIALRPTLYDPKTSRIVWSQTDYACHPVKNIHHRELVISSTNALSGSLPDLFTN